MDRGDETEQLEAGERGWGSVLISLTERHGEKVLHSIPYKCKTMSKKEGKTVS